MPFFAAFRLLPLIISLMLICRMPPLPADIFADFRHGTRYALFLFHYADAFAAYCCYADADDASICH